MWKTITLLITCILIASTVSAAEKTVAGKVSTVDAAKNSITVGGVALDVSRKTKITIDGKKCTLADIKSGQQAKVTFDDVLETAISIGVGKDAEGDDEATAKAMKSLQGEWKCIASEENGKTTDKSVMKKWNRRITIKGNSLTMEKVSGEGKLQSYVGKFEIDASNGHFDWVGKGPLGAHLDWIGIYELDEDILKVCFINQIDEKAKRPKDFRTMPPAGPDLWHVYYTFKRDND